MSQRYLDAAPLGMLVLRDQRIVYANEAMARIAGRSCEALVGQRLVDMLPLDEVAAFTARHARALRGEPVPRAYELTLLSGEGGPRTVEVFSSVDGEEVILQVQDLTATLQGARRLADLSRRNADLAALNRIADAARAAPDLAAFLPAGVDEVVQTLGCDGVSVYLLAEGDTGLTLAHQRGGSPELAALLAKLPIDMERVGRGVGTGRARVLAVDELGAPFRDLLAPAGFSVLASLPLSVGANVVGLLSVAYRERRVIEPSRLELLEAMGAHFAAKVESHRLLVDLRGRVRELTLLNEMGRTLVATLDLKAVLDEGAGILARIAEAPAAYIALPDAASKNLVIQAAAGAHRELAGRALPLVPVGDSLMAWVFQHRELTLVEDMRTDPRVHQTLRAASEGHACLAVPLVVRDRAIGAAAVIDPRGPRRFTPAEVERVQAICNQLAIAVENARLYEDLRESYATLGRTQEQLVQRERLAALGELAAVVAHEVRNPLGVLFNSLSSLRRLLEPEGEVQMLLDIMAEEAVHLNRIVSELLDFARPTAPTLMPERLDRVLDEAVGVALTEAPAGRIRLERAVDVDLPPVPMDARLMRQAMINVALNAVQAMPDGGALRISARCAAGDAVRVEIGDTGPGIPAGVLERIFEPFFTTKPSGSGLGLVVVKRVVEAHRGQLAVESAAGVGTTFAIVLPAVRQE